jgi:hypothetical protein
MIKITLGTDGKEIFDSIEIHEPTLKECAIINFRLDQIKQDIINREFESKFEVSEGDFSEDED